MLKFKLKLNKLLYHYQLSLIGQNFHININQTLLEPDFIGQNFYINIKQASSSRTFTSTLTKPYRQSCK